MVHTLQSLPVETVETIAEFLTLEDLRNLRLTAKELSAKATQGTFKSYFVVKRLSLTERNLQNFVRVTKAGGLGCLLEKLFLSTTVYDTAPLKQIIKDGFWWDKETNGPMFFSRQHRCSEEDLAVTTANLQHLERLQNESIEFEESGRDVALLSQAFENLAAYSPRRQLNEIWMWVMMSNERFESTKAPIFGGDWSLISSKLGYTCRTVVSSLTHSGLPVDNLDIASEVLRCSLPLQELAQVNALGKKAVRSFIKTSTMSISLCDDAVPESMTAKGLLKGGADADLLAIPRFIADAPKIEELDLHFYQTTPPKTDGDIDHMAVQRRRVQIFENFAHADILPHLKRCRIRGFWVTSDSLLAFLRRSPLVLLRLENLHMVESTFQPVFDYCSDAENGLTSLYFDDLFEEGQLLYFKERYGAAKFPSFGHVAGTNTLERAGADVHHRIAYNFPSGRALGSPQLFRWTEKLRREYGPP